MRFQKILVPIDFSPGSRAALDTAIALAESLHGNVTVDLLHVWDEAGERLLPELELVTDSNGTATRLLREVRTQASSSLETAASFLGALEKEGIGLRATMTRGPVAETIVKTAIDGDYDLVVMGTHARTGVAHAVLGSVAEKVVNASIVPVLVARLPQGAEQRASA